MKNHFILYTATLIYGTVLAMNFAPESAIFVPVYCLAIYLLHRVNYTESFYLLFSHANSSADVPMVRLGPTELALKDEVEKNEGRFLEFFDCKRVKAQQVLSLLILFGSIYLIFFRMKILITPVPILGIFSAYILSRAVSVGHLLIPLTFNLIGVFINLPEYEKSGYGKLAIYGVLFIVNLSLIYPSKERLTQKLTDWPKGKLAELLRTLAVILIPFCGFFTLFHQMDLKDRFYSRDALRNDLAQVQGARSTLRNMSGMGMVKADNLEKQMDRLNHEMLELSGKEYSSELNVEVMKKKKEFLFRKLESLPETEAFPEIQTAPADPESLEKLRDLSQADVKKKELLQKLGDNIEEFRETGDQSLQWVNSALKEELLEVETLTGDEKKTMTSAAERAAAAAEELLIKTEQPELREKLSSIAEDNRQLSRTMTSQMKPEEKAEVARKLLESERKLEALRKEVREDLARKADAEVNQPEKKEEENPGKFLRRIFVFAAAALITWFINRMRKKGVKKSSVLTEEMKEELQVELRGLKSRRLSPREEVIETYNILHKGLASFLYKQETPPSCIVHANMGEAEPELGPHTYAVTETFARTFYGDKDVGESDLRAFRKGIRRVFGFFEIKF